MSMTVRGIWEFTGMEPPPADIKVNPVFCAYEFRTEAQSKVAWQRAWDVGTHVSVWRMKNPDDSAFQVICMGEKSKNVRKVEQVLIKHGGRSWTPEKSMIQALALRRYGTAVEEAQKGDKAETTIVHRWGEQGGMRLDPDGTMRPYIRREQ